MELFVGVVGVVGVVFVVVFGGRGLIDLVRGFSDRRQARQALADDSPGAAEGLGAATAVAVTVEVTEAQAAPAVAPPEASPVYRRTVVGRDAELEQLHEAFDEALAGHGSPVTVVGEPGIGKTRLCQDVAALAESRSIQVLCGYCYEGEGAPPYWPWIQILRAYVESHAPDVLLRVIGAGAADIAELLPELRTKLPDLSAPPTLQSPAQARFRLFDSIATFIRRASHETPLVLLLEDLHWADRSSLLLLEFVAKDIGSTRVLLLATYRDVAVTSRSPLSQTLGSLVSAQRFRRIQLGGMTQDGVGQLIEADSGIVPQPTLVETIHRRTDGNPLFVGQIVSLLSEDELSAEPQPDTRIPEGVRDAIGRGLERLSEGCNQVLTVASVIGREFGFDALRALVPDLSEEGLLEALEEAVEARVVERVPASTGSYRFSHALVQETLLEEVSVTRRVRLHAQIAEVLEGLYGDDAGEHAPELAHHFAEAEAVLGADKLVHYSRLAGEQSMASYAYEEAIVHLQRALASREGQPMDGEKAELLFGLGRAQAAALQTAEAGASLTQAFDYYTEAGDVARAVEVAEHPVDEGNTGLPELVTRALELVPADSHDAGRLLSHYGLALGEDNDYEGAQEAFDQALAIARREGDVALEMWTLSRAGHIELIHNRPQGCLVMHGQAVELNSRVDDPYAEVYARQCVAAVLISTGDPRGAQSHIDAMLTMADRTRYRRGLVQALRLSALAHLFKGDWALTRELLDRAQSLNPSSRFLMAARLFLEYTLGEVDRAKSVPEPALRPPHPVGFHIAMALGDGMAGNREHLEAVREAAVTVLSWSRTLPGDAMEANIALGLVAVGQADEAAAEEQYAALEPVRAMFPVLDACFLSVDRLLGLLALTMGQAGQALAHFDDAQAFCRNAGYRPELAWSLCGQADALLQRGGPADAETARASLEEGLTIAQELGMRPLVERAIALQQQAEARSQNPLP